jgi:hypothetical protein
MAAIFITICVVAVIINIYGPLLHKKLYSQYHLWYGSTTNDRRKDDDAGTEGNRQNQG